MESKKLSVDGLKFEIDRETRMVVMYTADWGKWCTAARPAFDAMDVAPAVKARFDAGLHGGEITSFPTIGFYPGRGLYDGPRETAAMESAAAAHFEHLKM